MNARPNETQTPALTKKYAMDLDAAYRLGQTLRTAGYSEQEVGDYLVERGYRANGTTARRVLRGYESIH